MGRRAGGNCADRRPSTAVGAAVPEPAAREGETRDRKDAAPAGGAGRRVPISRRTCATGKTRRRPEEPAGGSGSLEGDVLVARAAGAHRRGGGCEVVLVGR